jgi:chloramphenicol-sensitive protein RarD
MVHDERRGVVDGLAAYLLWGFLTIYWHELSGLSPVELIGQRILWSSLLLAVVLTIARNWGWVKTVVRQPRLLARLAIAAALLAANWFAYVYAVGHDNVVETALGYFIAPLGSVLVGVTVLHEHLRRAQSIGLALGALAVVVLTVDYGRVPWVALVLASSWSVYGLLKKLVPLTPIQSLTAETLLLLPVAAVIVVVVEATGHGVASDATSLQLFLIPLSGVVTVVPLLLFARAARFVPLSTLGLLQYLIPVINLVLGVALYHEPMPGWRVVGFALVWIALIVITIDGIRGVRVGVARSRADVDAAVSQGSMGA